MLSKVYIVHALCIRVNAVLLLFDLQFIILVFCVINLESSVPCF